MDHSQGLKYKRLFKYVQLVSQGDIIPAGNIESACWACWNWSANVDVNIEINIKNETIAGFLSPRNAQLLMTCVTDVYHRKK